MNPDQFRTNGKMTIEGEWRFLEKFGAIRRERGYLIIRDAEKYKQGRLALEKAYYQNQGKTKALSQIAEVSPEATEEITADEIPF